MLELLVDLSYGEEAYIKVSSSSSKEEIKEECLAQTGKPLFCVKKKFPLEEVKIQRVVRVLKGLLS